MDLFSHAEAPTREALTLNPEQQRAAEHDAGPLIVLAGPGTGKTRVMIGRILDLVERRGAEPESVLAVTFTNKAATELGERLSRYTDPDTADRVRASTFHKFGYSMLQRFASEAGLPSRLELLDSSQERLLLEDLVRTHRLFRNFARAGIDSAIERARNAIGAMHNAAVWPEQARAFAEQRSQALTGDSSPEASAERAELDLLAEHVQLATLMDQACADRGWLRFDDLIRRPIELLRTVPRVADMVRTGARHLLVDEFQDVNSAQIELLKLLAPPATNPDLAVVGDDDQAIYAFRGSDERSFERFRELWTTSTTVTLELNYRSAEPILQVASSTISQAASRFEPDKIIRGPEPDPEEPGAIEPVPVSVVDLPDEKESGQAIASAILRMRQGELGADEALRFDDFAVICRTNSEADTVRAELEIAGIPAISGRPASPLDDPGVMDLLAWIRLLVNPGDTPDLLRLLMRPPVGLAYDDATHLVRRYRADRSRTRQAQDFDVSGNPADMRDTPNATGEESEPPVRHALAWLRQHAADRPEIASMLAIADDLEQAASTDLADLAVMKIVRRTGAADADLVSGASRAERLRNLAAVVRFVRARTSRLEQPRDLAAFWRYYERLDQAEQSFDSDAEARLHADSPEGELPGQADAVRVLTAHKSKGLEFDTVFVARVVSPHGFPLKDLAGEPPIPPGLLPDDGAGPPRTQAHADEERRIFYVACTRAQRQLVLVGKVPKARSTAKSFLRDLVAAGNELPVQVLPMSEVLGHGAARDELESEALAYRERMQARELIDDARSQARLAAATALGGLERGEDSGVAQEAFVRAGDRLRLIAEAEAAGTVPSWAAEHGLSELAEHLERALRGEESERHLDPVPPPLHLSYSSLRAYLECPKCYHMQHVLRLPEREGTAQRVGTAVHEGLQAFYDQWREADAEGRPTPGPDVLYAEAERSFRNSWADDEELDHNQLVQIRGLLELFWERYHDDSAHISELERSVKLRWPLGEHTHTIAVKIDRVDMIDGGVRIIDYKTGNPSKSLRQVSKTDLQMGLYMLALRWLREDPELDGRCEYWLLQSGEIGPIGFSELNEAKIRARVDGAIEGILAGRFPKGNGCRGACESLDPHKT